MKHQSTHKAVNDLSGYRKTLLALLLAFLCLTLDGTSLSETAARLPEAENITKQVSIHLSSNSKRLPELRDGKYKTYLTLRAGGAIEMDGKGQELGGVFLQYYDRTAPCAVEIWNGEGWVNVADCGTYLTEWVALPAGTTKARLLNGDKARLMLAELTVYGPGSRPARATEWTTTDKADIMLVVCHPDDELLWFGGLLPTYAGERGLRVQVVYAVPSTPNRRLELLDGLWHCGVHIYPQFLGMRDAHSYSLTKQYKLWNRGTLQSRITEMIRRFKPEVLVTHDMKGEYGHGGHKAVADSTVLSITHAANPEKYADSAAEWGTWQVKKCYVHLWEQARVRYDWHKPLAAFDGKDGMKVATEALAFHRSQTGHGWEMEEGGPCDNSVFGLYSTTVGADEAGDDLMEHIWQDEQEELLAPDSGDVEVEEILLGEDDEV